MKRISKLCLGFLVFGFILSCARTPQRIELHPIYTIPRGTSEGPGIPFSMAEGFDAEKVKASTVGVVYDQDPSPIISSGFFVANDKIATNIHVVADANPATLRVKIDDAEYTIRGVTAYDAKNDLVILEITGEGVPLVLGDSDAVSSGETVFCTGYIGPPIDQFNAMENTVLPGRLSGVWLRVTPTSLPGTSGGPVVDAKGEVIGINVAGSGPIAYAIASNVLKDLLKQSGPVEPLAQWQKRDPIRASTYLIKASSAFYNADYAGAIDAVDKYIALNPTYANIDAIYNNRGRARTLLGHSKFEKDAAEAAQEDYRAAIQDLDKAISLNSVNVTAYANRGHAKTLFGHSEWISGRTAEARQYYRAAIEDFDKAMGPHPNFPAYAERGTVRVALGISETNRGRTTEAQQYYHAAIEDFDEAILYHQYDTYAYIIRGYTKICLADFEADKGNMENARNLYESAITDTDTKSAAQLDTKNPYAYHTLGVAKAKLEDYTAAIDDFSKAISLKPDFAEAYYNRAVTKKMLGQKDAARADFQKAAQLDQDEGK